MEAGESPTGGRVEESQHHHFLKRGVGRDTFYNAEYSVCAILRVRIAVIEEDGRNNNIHT